MKKTVKILTGTILGTILLVPIIMSIKTPTVAMNVKPYSEEAFLQKMIKKDCFAWFDKNWNEVHNCSLIIK